MTIHADTGAVIIKSLLEEPSASLEADVEALRVALEQIDPTTGAITDAQPPISRLRAYYAGLARRIKGTSTAAAGGPQREALNGLKQMDAGLGILASVIAQNAAPAAQTELERGVRQMRQAGVALEQAARSIT
jgi:hypothetical protein